MDELLSEKEQIEEIRKWWKENGTWVLGGLVLGVSILVGWNQWQSHVNAKAEQASVLYEEAREAAGAGDADTVAKKVETLVAEYGSTPYDEQASLVLAKAMVEQGRLDEAASALDYVVQGKAEPQLVLVARTRLAQVRMQQGRHEDALAALAVDDAGAFGARYSELRGDIAVSRGDIATARTEYELALSVLNAGPVNRELVGIKLNDLPQVEVAAPAEADAQ